MDSADPISGSRAYQVALGAAAAALTALGLYLSGIRWLDTEWLSRAGCLVVILGIGSGLAVIVQERLLASRLRRHRRNAMVQAKARHDASEIGQEELDRELAAIDENFDKHSADLTHRLRMTFGAPEVSLLIVGTFLWGFGDLIVRALIAS